MKKISLLFGIGVISAVVVAVYAGFSFWQESVVSAETKKVESALLEVQNKVLKYENNNIEQAIAAKQTLSELSDTIVYWSRIIKEIRRTIPKDKKGNPLVEILSYSGSGSNDITMNVKTTSKSDEPYFDAADLIEAFDESEHFMESFVPSISKGSDLEGASVLTFMFSTLYLEEEVIEEAISDVLEVLIER